MDYIDKIIKDCQSAKKACALREFEMQNIDNLSGITHAIYIFEEIEGDAQKTYDELKVYKAKKKRACPKINTPSSILYVGSTTTGLKKRIIQHMGDGPKGTYALHLKHWFKGQYKVTIKEYDVTKSVLQIIEDALSADLCPAFGKSGANNK